MHGSKKRHSQWGQTTGFPFFGEFLELGEEKKSTVSWMHGSHVFSTTVERQAPNVYTPEN